MVAKQQLVRKKSRIRFVLFNDIMSWIKRNIPNFFTLLNLSLGIIAINMVLTRDSNSTPVIHYYVFAAGVCDLLDGLIARKLKVQSEFGLQLDSLSDLVTFGVLPTFIYASFIPLEGWGLLLLSVPICSAIRLAIFNIDSDQKSSFKGISTTAHGLFVATLPIIMFNQNGWFSQLFTDQYWLFIVLAVFFSLLMISPFRMISFKFQNMSLRENWQKYFLIISSLALIVVLQYESAPVIMFIYILLSAAGNFQLLQSKSTA